MLFITTILGSNSCKQLAKFMTTDVSAVRPALCEAFSSSPTHHSMVGILDTGEAVRSSAPIKIHVIIVLYSYCSWLFMGILAQYNGVHIAA